MKKILFSILTLILVACAAPTPAPTATATILPTITLTATPTFTPTVTFTPTPALPAEIVTSVETALPGYKLHGDQLMDIAGNIVPEIRIVVWEDGKTWTGNRPAYDFEVDGDKFTMLVTVIKPEDFEVLEDGTIRIQGVWDVKDGKLERVHAELNGADIDMVKYSIAEAVEMLREDSQKANGKLNNSESNARARKVLGFDNKTPTVRVGGRTFMALESYFGDSRIYLADKDGKKAGEEPTLFYAWTPVTEGNQTVVKWLTSDGKEREIFVGDYLNSSLDTYYSTGMTEFQVEK